MAYVTVGILACDNEDEIADCLASAAWADERLVVLDDRSSDRTAEIARAMGARIVRHPFRDFASQRDYGLSIVEADWLFYLDSDERCTPEVAAEAREVTERDDVAGWWVPRHNVIWGHDIGHGGWYPDYQLRLLRVGRARYDPQRPVHEVVLLDGPEGHLRAPLVHYNYRTVSQFVAKQRQYVELEAGILQAKGVRPRPWTYVTQPLREFYRRYVRLQGYRDGAAGLLLCALVAYYYGFRATVALGRRLAREGSPANQGSG